MEKIKGKVTDALQGVGQGLPATSQIAKWKMRWRSGSQGLRDHKKKILFAILADSRVGSKNKDFMWRIAMGALKTGELISKYKIKGTRVGCVFCEVADGRTLIFEVLCFR